MYFREKVTDHDYEVTGLVEGSNYHFRISAENVAGVGSSSSEVGPITAKDLIKFTIPLEDQDVKIEDSVELMCEVNKDNVSTTWYKDGNVLKSSDRYNIVQDGRRHRLLIKDVTLDDESEYSCKVVIYSLNFRFIVSIFSVYFRHLKCFCVFKCMTCL